MITKIKYQQISGMVPGDAFNFLEQLPKFSVRDAKLIDVLNEKVFDKPLIECYYRDLSPKGVYLFYNCNNKIRYIGQTNQSFYQRLLTQLDTTYYPGFGWNSMLSLMGRQRKKTTHAEINEEDHEVDFQEVCDYKLLLIEAGYGDELTPYQIKALEKILLKTYRESDGNTLLNTRIGWLNRLDWNKTIEELIENNTRN